MIARALLALVVLSASARLLGQTQPAVPLEPVAAVLDAFRAHTIVALGEGTHNNEQGAAFRLALIRDPRFPLLVNDIVVESGSSKYQDLMDRFVRGESVPDGALRRVWQDTTEPDPVWDVPIYEAFFRAIRAVNMSLARDRQLRVLLGDPPFDWDAAATREDWMRTARIRQSDQFLADLIQREVLSKGRRALVIYGDTHFVRQPPLGGSNLVTRLGAACPSCVFNIWTHTVGGDLRTLQPDVSGWRVPALTMTKRSPIGAAPFGFFRAGGSDGPRMEDQFDAVLFVGPLSAVTKSVLPPALCADSEYMKMRLGRMAIADPPSQQVPAGILRPSDRLKQYCASVAR